MARPMMASGALVSDWTAEDHDYLRAEVPRRALKTEFRGRPMIELAGKAVEISRGGWRAGRAWIPPAPMRSTTSTPWSTSWSGG